MTSRQLPFRRPERLSDHSLTELIHCCIEARPTFLRCAFAKTKNGDIDFWREVLQNFTIKNGGHDGIWTWAAARDVVTSACHRSPTSWAEEEPLYTELGAAVRKWTQITRLRKRCTFLDADPDDFYLDDLKQRFKDTLLSLACDVKMARVFGQKEAQEDLLRSLLAAEGKRVAREKEAVNRLKRGDVDALKVLDDPDAMVEHRRIAEDHRLEQRLKHAKDAQQLEESTDEKHNGEGDKTDGRKRKKRQEDGITGKPKRRKSTGLRHTEATEMTRDSSDISKTSIQSAASRQPDNLVGVETMFTSKINEASAPSGKGELNPTPFQGHEPSAGEGKQETNKASRAQPIPSKATEMRHGKRSSPAQKPSPPPNAPTGPRGHAWSRRRSFPVASSRQPRSGRWNANTGSPLNRHKKRCPSTPGPDKDLPNEEQDGYIDQKIQRALYEALGAVQASMRTTKGGSSGSADAERNTKMGAMRF